MADDTARDRCDRGKTHRECRSPSRDDSSSSRAALDKSRSPVRGIVIQHWPHRTQSPPAARISELKPLLPSGLSDLRGFSFSEFSVDYYARPCLTLAFCPAQSPTDSITGRLVEGSAPSRQHQPGPTRLPFSTPVRPQARCTHRPQRATPVSPEHHLDGFDSHSISATHFFWAQLRDNSCARRLRVFCFPGSSL
jgi:hypothetical protein